MTRRTLLPVLALGGAILAAACGGAAGPAANVSPTGAASTAPATTPAATTPAATSAAPASASPAGTAAASATTAPPHAGVGAASVKLTESKLVATAAPVHVSFFGDEPSLGAGTYQELLNLVTLQPGGRTVSHRHGGVEWVTVTEGTIEVRTPGARTTLTVGQTAKVPANTAVQAVNTGTGVAKFLAFFVTAEGAAFQTNLDTVP